MSNTGLVALFTPHAQACHCFDFGFGLLFRNELVILWSYTEQNYRKKMHRKLIDTESVT
jgi:hypothetical protein